MGNEVQRTRETWVRRRPNPLGWILEAYYRLYILYATQRAVNNVAHVVNTVVQGVTNGTIRIKNRADFISLINTTEELRLTYYQNVLYNNMKGDFWVAFPGHLPFPRISNDRYMNYNFDIRNPFVNI
jgi:hypothetical protein